MIFYRKIHVSKQEIRPECKVYELRYRPMAQCSLYKFPIPKKNVIFNIHHLLCKKQIFFFLVNSSNLMDTIEIIIVLIELLLNSTVNS